jgi:hypothetical protein
LAAGGVTRTLFRKHDWTHSGLGPVDSWPQILLTIIASFIEFQVKCNVIPGKTDDEVD